MNVKSSPAGIPVVGFVAEGIDAKSIVNWFAPVPNMSATAMEAPMEDAAAKKTNTVEATRFQNVIEMSPCWVPILNCHCLAGFSRYPQMRLF